MNLQRIAPDTGKEAANAIYNNNLAALERENALLWKAIQQGQQPPRKRR